MQHQDESQDITLSERNQTQKATDRMIIRPGKIKTIGTKIRAVFAMGLGMGEGSDCKADGRNFLEL